jgi:ubiquinone/menaquinone biosynthesis C-methylase UbiE
MKEINNKARMIKEEIEAFYEKQSLQKTSELNKWLESGGPRIPQSKTYYYFEDRKIKNALEMANLESNAKIMEVGCNLGQMTFVLQKNGYSVVGMDISHNAIEKAMMRVNYYKLKGISFEVQDAENIKGHSDGEFDAVFSFSSFRYFPNAEKALLECYRLVKSKGCVVIDFPNRYCPWFSILKSAFFIKKHIHDNLFDVIQIRKIMVESGFVDIQVNQFLFTYKELPSFLLPVLKAIDFIFERIPFIRKYAAIIMVKGTKP